MFNSITWGQYLFIISGALIIYYILIGFRFFKWEILKMIGIKKVEAYSFSAKSINDVQSNNTHENTNTNVPQTTLEDDVTTLIQSFTDEIKAFVNGTHDIDAGKKDIIDSVKSILLKYAALKESIYETDLKIFVFKEINQRFPELLKIKDLNRIWN